MRTFSVVLVGEGTFWPLFRGLLDPLFWILLPPLLTAALTLSLEGPFLGSQVVAGDWRQDERRGAVMGIVEAFQLVVASTHHDVEGSLVLPEGFAQIW